MLNDYYPEYRKLPAINETFPQFNRPSLSLLSPLDLSLRATNIIPITPPSTPSPPRKRPRLMSDENYLWRPHTMETLVLSQSPADNKSISNTVTTDDVISTATITTTNTIRHEENVAKACDVGIRPTIAQHSIIINEDNYFQSLTYTHHQQHHHRQQQQATGNNGYNNLHETTNNRNFIEIPESQRGMMPEGQQQQSLQQQRSQLKEMAKHRQLADQRSAEAMAEAKIYVEDETIVLTEDEDEATVVSSQDYNEEDNENECETSNLPSDVDVDVDADVEADAGCEVDADIDVDSSDNISVAGRDGGNQTKEFETNDDDDDEEEEYVDILSNDDDDINPLIATTTFQRLQCQLVEEELEQSGKVLTRNKLIYDNEELHNQAVNGLEKLFKRDFVPPPPPPSSTAATTTTSQTSTTTETEATAVPTADCEIDKDINNVTASTSKKTYFDLSAKTHDKTVEVVQPLPLNCFKTADSMQTAQQQQLQKQQSFQHPAHHHHQHLEHQQHHQHHQHQHHHKPHKVERKRMKMRKHHGIDEETISPVSGTIIRKLRDDEELVVRKGDIDPAFNVVEITEEAKAILASIDNKIGAYICQLCRTLYDDAFMLAQHRCPRIVHIEYKCSECEKVFNCPANLASHKRWHKPKSELLANSQNKKRQAFNSELSNVSHDQSPVNEDTLDGIFPCNQCGKTFRRHAYLKKHQASHQMLENLKSLDLFKNSTNPTNSTAFPYNQPQNHHSTIFGAAVPRYTPANLYYPTLQQQHPHPHHHHQHHPNNHHQQHQHPQHHPSHAHQITKGAPLSTQPTTNHQQQTRFSNAFAFPTFDQRRFYALGELYLSQQLERSSAFHSVQANHLRNLSTAMGSFLPHPRPLMPSASSLMSLPVK